MAGSLAVMLVLVLLDGSDAFARGRRGGGAAGALDDFDLFLQMDATNGLPPNLVSGFEPANSIPGDVTVGAGGTFSLDQLRETINSQSGESVILLPSSVNGSQSGSGGGINAGGSGHRAGMARKLGPEGLPAMRSLKSVPIPSVPELTRFIRDRNAAILLGKAFFWDVQAGSDGNACASCHFHAGADNRMRNQLSPGLKGGDQVFQPTASGGVGGPNYKLKPEDFPFHRLADPLDRNSQVLFDSNDVVSSQGAFGGLFLQLAPDGSERCGDRPSPDSFNVTGIPTRRVAPRNTPSAINAVFNYRNFWDGRANNVFNGVSPFGPRDPNARVLEQLPDGGTVWASIALRNASLASQAVGPALSEFEMSCENRGFKDLGRKLLGLRALRLQEVHPQDSVLGSHVARDGRGIKQSYLELIRAAFEPRWWNAPGDFDGYTQMEINFSLYWGLAIMMYESTLVSDETPFDRLVGDPAHPAKPDALTPRQLRGLAIFRGKGQCVSCHKGAEFTGAGTSLQPDDGEGSVLESMFLKTGELGVYDNGFYNIGVRPAAEDRGVGASDPFGNPLSLTRNWFDQLRSRAVADPVWADPCLFAIFFDASACWIAPDANSTRIVADGAFKTPSLRNVAFTQPYFHSGSYFTLEQVVEFYNRGGDRRGPDDNDTTGFVGPDAPNGGTTNLHPNIRPLGLTQGEIGDLVDFMRHALTDPRVACERAPFDHPSLRLHDGHAGDEIAVKDANHNGLADDKYEMLPAVGRDGRAKAQCLRNDDGSPVAGLTDAPAPTVPPPGLPPPSAPPAGTPPPGTPPASVPPPASAPKPSAPPVSVAKTPAAPQTSVPAAGKPRSTVRAAGSSTTRVAGVTGGMPGSAAPWLTVADADAVANNRASAANGNTAAQASERSNSSAGSGTEARGSAASESNGTERGSAARRSSLPGRNGEARASSEAESGSSGSDEQEPARRTPPATSPSVTLNAPAEVMARSRVTIYGSISTGSTFTWTQTSGPAVELSGANTLAPSFTAPPPNATLVFELTATNADGASATATSTVKTVADEVKVGSVTWARQQGRVSVVATSSAINAKTPAPPDGMTMTASLWSKTIPAGLPGSSTKPVEVPMTLVKNVAGKPPVCAGTLPCFSTELADGIVDPRSPPEKPQFLPPTTVVIKSSLGGSGTAAGAEIRIR